MEVLSSISPSVHRSFDTRTCIGLLSTEFRLRNALFPRSQNSKPSPSITGFSFELVSVSQTSQLRLPYYFSLCLLLGL